MAKGQWHRKKGLLGRSVEAGRRGGPLLAAGFLGAWLTRFFRDDGAEPEVAESLQDPLLIAVSSASPVALPDAGEGLFETETRFVIALAPHDQLRPMQAKEPTVGLSPPERSASAQEEDDDDEGILWWDHGSSLADSTGYVTDITPHLGASAPGAPAKAFEQPTGNIVSKTRLPQSQDEALSPVRPESLPDDVDPSQRPALEEERFVSITQLNEQMGPPAPEEDDDDEAGWLWWGDGVLAWFATATAGLLGGTGSGAGAVVRDSGSEIVRSGLEIAFAAGPFVDGELTLKAVDINGDALFTYSGESVGSTLADGVRLTGISTETVLGESVITGLDVEFDDFAGRVFLQVDEGSQYLDEALGVNAQAAIDALTALDTPLRAVAEVPFGDMGSVNISPFTELAIRIIQDAKGMEVSLDTPDRASLADTQDLYDSAAERVQEIVGVDIRTTRPVAVNQESFADNALTDISQYGLKLAALSKFGEDQGLGVTDALARLIDAVEPSADDEAKFIVFTKPGAALNNRALLTDSQDAFVLADDDVAAFVIDAVRPAFAPVIDPVVVVEAGTVTINGTAFFFDTDNSAGDPSALSVFMALGDSTVFTVDGVEGSGSGALEVSGGEPLDDGSIPSGDWSLRIDDLDQGVYTFDAYVVDEGANVTRSAPSSGDTAPTLVLVGGTSGDSNATELEITLTEGDTAADVSGNASLVTVDLGSGDEVSVDNLAVSSASNPLGFSEAELLDLISIADGTGQSVSLGDGTLLDSASNLASLQWSFAGDAAVFDALGSGDAFAVTYSLQGIDTDNILSNSAVLEVTVTGTNDAPVNTVSAATGDEDTVIPLTGLAVSDVDETGEITVTLSVQNGRLNIADDVSGGLTAGDVSGDGSDSMTLVGSIDEINTTLATAGALSYQGDSHFNGTDTLTMTTTDSIGDAAVDEVPITVNAVNDPPAFPSLLVGEVKDGSLGGDQDFQTSNLSGDFSLQADDPDADGDLTFTLTGDGEGGFGSLSLNAAGSYQYTPDVSAVEALGFGESDSDTFLITVTDPEGATGSGFFRVNAIGANDAPTVDGAIDVQSTEDDGPITVELLSGADDIDATDTLTVTNSVYRVDGELTASGGNTLPDGVVVSDDTVTVDTNSSFFQSLGADSTRDIVISYDVADDSGQSNDSVSQTATITVTGINDAPTLSALSAGSVIDGPGAGSGDFTASDLTGSFAAAGSDTDATDTLTFSVSGDSSGTFGELVLSGDGSYRYQMDVAAVDGLGAGESGSDRFVVEVSDGNGGVATQTFTVDVTGANDTPFVASELASTVTEDGTDAVIDLFQGASDRDNNDQLSVSSLIYRVGGVLTGSGGSSLPDGLSVSGDSVRVDADASVFQTLGSGDQQIITVDYDIKDDSNEANDTVAQTLTITIDGVDDPPRFDGPLPAGSISEDPDASTRTSSGLSGDFSSLMTVVDSGDTVDFSVSGGVSGSTGTFGELVVQADGSYFFFPNTAVIEALSSGDSDSDTFTIIATASNGEQSSATYTVNVSGANDLPTLAALTSGAITDGAGAGSGDFTTRSLTGSFAASGGDVDADDALTFSVSGSSSGTFGDLTVSDDGSYAYAFNEGAVDALGVGETGTDTFTIEVDDGNSGTATQSFTVDVTGANDTPTVAAALAGAVTEDGGDASIDLLSGASDRDSNDTLSVTGVTYTVDDSLTGNSGSDVPTGLSRSGDTVTVDVSAFQGLGSGDVQEIVVSYDVQDDSAQSNDSVAQSATITVTGINDAPTLVTTDIATTEADLGGAGLTVDAASSLLLDGADDVDHADDQLVIDGFGADQLREASGGEALAIDLDYINDGGTAATGTVDLTLNADGSYQLDNLSFSNLGAGEVASGDFYYQVADPEGADSGLEKASITIQSGAGESTLDVDLSAGPFISTTFAVEGYADDGTHLFTYEAGELTHAETGVTLTDIVEDVGLRAGLSLPSQAQNVLSSLPGGGPSAVPPGLSDSGTGITKGFQLRFDDYDGDVVLRVKDAVGKTAAYVDEATSDAVDLDAELRALASLTPGGTASKSITPFSEAAVRLAEQGGQSLDFSALTGSQINSLRSFYQSASEIVDELAGVNPGSQSARPVNLDLGGAPEVEQDNQYGLKLAALSKSDISVANGLNNLLSGFSVTADGSTLAITDRAAFIGSKVNLTAALNDFKSQGPADAQPTAPGSGDFTVIDQTAPNQASITVDTLRTNATQPVLTGTVDLTDALNEASAEETLDFQVIFNGVVYDYAGGSGDIAVSGDGSWELDLAAVGATALPEDTYSVTAVLTDAAENATADATNNELIIDLTAPSTEISPAQRIIAAEDLFSVPITFSEAVASYDSGKTDTNTSLFTLFSSQVETPNAEQQFALQGQSVATSQFATISLAAGASTDAAGNETLSSNTERLIVLGDDAIIGDTRDEVLDDTFKRSDDSSRVVADGEFIFGDAGDDIIFGYGGDDVLMGAEGDDVLLGQDGADTFLAGAGDDVMAGGSGDDIYLLDEFGPDIGAENSFIGNDGVDQVQLRQSTADYLINRVTAAQVTEFNNLLNTGDSNNNGETEFRGFDTPDLQFDPTKPVLRIDQVTDAGRQTDFVQAEELLFSDTTLVFQTLDGQAFLTVESASDSFVYNGGGRPVQETGDNFVLGQSGADRLIGGDGDDDLRGGDGDDVLVSLGGADRLDGGSGDDTLIAFGRGDGLPVELTGGAGADTFVIVPQALGSTGYTIKDFSLEEDLIDLDGLLSASGDEFTTADLVTVFSEGIIDDTNDALEIDLSDFSVQDPDDADGFVSSGGILRIEFESDVNTTDKNPSARINAADENPVQQRDWWNDLLTDGGLI